MRIALVSMPWLDCHVPSAALAALSAYVRHVAPEFDVAIRPEHLEVAARLDFPTYRAVQKAPLAGEALYAGLLYPEKRSGLTAFLQRPTGEGPGLRSSVESTEPPSQAWSIPPDRVLEVLDTHATELAECLAAQFQVVGFTTPFRQLFASALVGRRLKSLNPDIWIVWGGSLTRGAAGVSLLREFPEIDAVIQGEGERPFVSLLRGISDGGGPPADEPGILTRENMDQHPGGVPVWEAEDVSALPPPDFDSFRTLADPQSAEWCLWVQSARGCWWDRSGRTGNPRHRCLFCNMNERRVYQAKPARQVAAEIDALVERHANPRVILNDLSMRPRGITALGRALAGLGRQLSLQMEIRAGIRPRELLTLWEAGLSWAHTGIEGFSTSYLRRMGKGVTLIHNLELLKTCAELEIANPFSLVTEFPGSTGAEVAESVRNIERYATAYPPPGYILSFSLTACSAVDMFREDFGVIRVRNHSLYRDFLPEEVCARLILPHLEWDYTAAGQPADWGPLREACRRWQERHEAIRAEALRGERLPPKPLAYADGGSFLEVTDYRGTPRRLHLTGPWREVYLECLEIRTRDQLEARFAASLDGAKLGDILERCEAERILFAEDGRYLALACATRPDIAARRIRKARRAR
jgi:ribosomal peptide maturation radical SAM protein 1